MNRNVNSTLQRLEPNRHIIIYCVHADGYGAQVSFDKNGDSKGRYNIMNYRRNRATRRFEYVTIGRWADELPLFHGDGS